MVMEYGKMAAIAARADVGIGPYTPHLIFHPNRRGGYQLSAWPRCRSAPAERRGAAIPP